MKLSNKQHEEIYRRQLRIRIFEEEAVALHSGGEILGALHTAAGQEGEIVGACMALNEDDYMVGNHRSHGHPIGKGANINRLMAELLGRKTGICQGKGGSMHLSDFGVGSLGETSIVGSGLPVAVGAALGAKMQKTGRVALCFFGDGASNEGTFHEALNLAAIWKLPVIFLCENNLYGMTTPAKQVVSVKDIASRGAGYDMTSVIVDGQDVLAVHEVVSEAAKRARAGKGPSLVEAKTYRYMEHAAGMGRDFNYRSQEEIDQWKKRDPIVLFRQKMMESLGFSDKAVAAIETEVRKEVADAIAFARQSPFPKPEEAYDHVYTNPIPVRH